MWKKRRKYTFFQSDDSGHPYRPLGSSIQMTRVKRYEKSIFSPSSIGIFSLSSSFTTPIAIERCMRLVSSRRTPFTLNSLFLRNKKTFVKGFFHTTNYYRPTQTDVKDYKNANGLKYIQLFTQKNSGCLGSAQAFSNFQLVSLYSSPPKWRACSGQTTMHRPQEIHFFSSVL